MAAKILWILMSTMCLLCTSLKGQADTIILGYGGSNIVVTASSSTVPGSENNTVSQVGFLPNENAASRFLSHATLGHDQIDIDEVMEMGIEDWMTNQLIMPRAFTIESKVRFYHQLVKDSTNNQSATTSNRMWDYSFWQYLMTSNDVLRQRVALALSEMLVISENSAFSNNGYALGVYYDKLLAHGLGNYRDLLTAITYSPSMGMYLTYLNNPKSNPTANQFPDENYAREVMQLFTIGTVLLNNDGSVVLDNNNLPLPSYDNEDIIEFSKIFTGLTWADRTQWNRGPLNDTSYIPNMVMWDTWHEPGVKNLLNGFQVPNRNPVDGDADITDALDNLFNHQNTPPFVCRFLIQRLVTSNPSPQYINRVANVFKNNGQGVRGDLAAVVRAILLDSEATDCAKGDETTFGMLREPLVRYIQINKALNASTLSGNYRNDMNNIYLLTGQRPLASPSVFNFFQQDYQPVGPITDAQLVAPEFQITDAQTIAGYVNGLYRWLFSNDIADEYDIFTGENDVFYADEISTVDLSGEFVNTTNDRIHILLDKLNLVLAHGRISATGLATITSVINQFPFTTNNEKTDRIKLAIYLIMTSPEYLINR
jgi:uncharacterized protein (DUF1800 family)